MEDSVTTCDSDINASDQEVVSSKPTGLRSGWEKKTGKKLPANDPFYVRNSLMTDEAMKAYDKYLKEHARRLKQLEAIARGDCAPSWYYE